MKDSEGRQYDGWCLRYPEDWGGLLMKYVYARTRSEVWDSFLGPYEIEQGRRARIAKYRRSGFVMVKVRIEEVKS